MTTQPDPQHPATPADRPSPDPQRPGAEGFAVAAAQMLGDFDCADIRVLDVRGASPITSYIVIASGTSDRQLRSLATRLGHLGAEQGFARYGDDTDAAATWMVADFVEVMVHLFEPATRDHYDLEMLWGDAPEVRWQRRSGR